MKLGAFFSLHVGLCPISYDVFSRPY